MKIQKIYLALALALALATGCQKDDGIGSENKEPAQSPISFNSQMEEDNSTRATGIALYYYQKNMKLYGTKVVSGVESKVFSNYRIQYLDASKTWEYEAHYHDSLKGQIAKFWDPEATQYTFYAGAPYRYTEIDETNRILTIKGLKCESADASSTITTGYLFSEPKVVLNSDFEKTVMLTFKLAMCRVKVAFVFKTAQTNDVTLADISFGPEGGTYIYQGDLNVTYTSGASPTYTWTTTPTESHSYELDYSNTTITAPGTTNTFTSEIYYMIPQSSAVDWKMVVGSLTGKNTATVDKEYMKWEPGHQYLYVFQLSTAETDPTIKFITCVQTAIDDWETATSSDNTVYNW